MGHDGCKQQERTAKACASTASFNSTKTTTLNKTISHHMTTSRLVAVTTAPVGLILIMLAIVSTVVTPPATEAARRGMGHFMQASLALVCVGATAAAIDHERGL